MSRLAELFDKYIKRGDESASSYHRLVYNEKLFTYGWVIFLIATGLLAYFSGLNIYNNPVLAHTFEFLLTFTLQVFILYALLNQTVGDDVEVHLGKATVASVAIYAIFVITCRVLIVQWLDIPLFVGPEYLAYSGYIPADKLVWFYFVVPISLVLQLVAIKYTTRLRYESILPAFLLNLVLGQFSILIANMMLYFAIYAKWVH